MSNKVIYVQSSDIKSRTFQEYRHDMKKKAIVELEFLPVLETVLETVLEAILRKKENDKFLVVEKYGVDSKIWFVQACCEDFVLKTSNRIRNNFQSDGSCLHEPHTAPVEAICATLFTSNFLEDIVQYLHFKGSTRVEPIRKIFDFLPSVSSTATYLQKNMREEETA